MATSRLSNPLSKRVAALLAACMISVGLVACSPDSASESGAEPEEETAPPVTAVPTQTTAFSNDVEASGTLFTESPVAVVASTDELAQARAAVAALALQAPMLTLGDNADAVAAELDRLGVETVFSVGNVSVPADVKVMVDPGTTDALSTVLGTEVQVGEATTVSSLIDMDPAAPSAPEMPTEAPEDQPDAQDGPEGAEEPEEQAGAEDGPAADPDSDAQDGQDAGAEGPNDGQGPGAEHGEEANQSGAQEGVESGDPQVVDLAPLEKGAVGPGNEDAAVFATNASPLGLIANARTAGLNPMLLPTADPRATADSMKLMRENQIAVGLGPDFGGTERLTTTAQIAANAEELPGGGGLVFPGRRMVALYGHPWGGALGVLGEQGAEDAAAIAQQYADQYQEFSPEPVIPAFEIIATVAAGGAGDDGNYSNITPAEDLVPYVDAVTEAGGYAIIDLQPGRAHLLDQAKVYEDLLKRPNVGLALDPEWKLHGDEVPLQQVGHIDVSEANEVADWLAELTRENQLPQKVFMLHQFQTQMIRNREQLNTDHPELATVIHADGHGTPGQKMDTWNAMLTDLPSGVWMAWKNFIDEDQPMLTPQQTMEIEPRPWIVSFQ